MVESWLNERVDNDKANKECFCSFNCRAAVFRAYRSCVKFLILKIESFH